MRTYSFHVPGTPAQQGNHRRNQHGATYETSKNHAPWRDSVIWHAREARPPGVDVLLGGIVFDGPVAAALFFRYLRPKSHYRTGRNSHLLKDGAPEKVTAPDIDKLVRAALDALTIAGWWRDDAQVVRLTASKFYVSANPGMGVEIGPAADFTAWTPDKLGAA